MTEYIITKDDFELLQENPAYLDSAFKFARIYDLKHEPREEIIRCRDCKNRAYSEEVCSDECKVTFDHIGTINGRDAYARRLVKPNDTCSWAERDER